jgi:hypothetical protein
VQVELYSKLIDRLVTKKASAEFMFKPPTMQDLSSVAFADDVNTAQDSAAGDRSARRSARGQQSARRIDTGITGLDIANVYYRSQVNVTNTTSLYT